MPSLPAEASDAQKPLCRPATRRGGRSSLIPHKESIDDNSYENLLLESFALVVWWNVQTLKGMCLYVLYGRWYASTCYLLGVGSN